MHFAARFIGKTYAEFASDFRVLVEANIRCMDFFQLAKRLIKKEHGRKFILSGGCEITVNTPADNLKAMRCASKIK